MDKLLLKLFDIIDAKFGSWAYYIVAVIIGMFLAILLYEKYNLAKIKYNANSFKKFELFLSVFDSMETKSPIVIEQGFLNYFGFYLSNSEIVNCLDSLKPTEFINDLKKASNLVDFVSGKYKSKALFPLSIRKWFSNFAYMIVCCLGFVCYYYFITDLKIAWLMPIILLSYLGYLSLGLISSSYAAIRICSGYPKRNTNDNVLILSEKFITKQSR
ncbi:hypothetical protein [Photobacterium kasasachensis]|uniref:hypothetical protein n=1 Tax=Photobacterium kasasachensis TaxID=2910240 RepID=UPI003D09B62B